ncbi:DUF11 domain-containing protein [Limnoglobus roseus]|uniref:Uncharacterized protein n=1 Tax=Limnoglobus roseus TaxID=2598579 RepID=A0A5C1A7C8_9BACT|nr:SdrD B-like domain-containing protein [Limnoglobus roseus]QEL14097.1 DUF11 hypothetical protein [Limnoglobus roseus]
MIDFRKLNAQRLVAGASPRRRTSQKAVPSSIAVTQLEDRLQPAAPIQFFYLPLPEQPTLAALEVLGTGSQGSDMTSLTAITTTETGTTIYYDQWEDGYETNLASPTQASTQIWGDGNDANGIAPGFANDPAVLPAGTVLELRNDIPAKPRVPGNLFFDGSDRVGADKTVAISRAQFPVTGGSVIGATVETRDTRYYDTAFTSPVGTDTANASNMFDYAQLFVMAAQDNTLVEIDANHDGTYEQAVTLNQGQNLVSASNILQGAKVRASKPVQVDLITGPINSMYAARTYALFSDNQLASDYFTPVGTVSGTDAQGKSHADPVWLFVQNPSTTDTITVQYETQSASGTVAVLAPGASGRFVVPGDTGTRLFTPNNKKFAALGAHDAGGTVHDWGFSLQPISALSQIAVVGLGVGDSNDPPTSNTSPIWVTAARLSGAATTSVVYVDYDGNPATGPLTDPMGNHYNVAYTLNRLQAQRVADPDNNNSGMRLYTLDGALISTAWGEGPTALQGAPGFDAGTTIPALAVPEFYKFVDFAPGGDVNNDGYYNSGDVLRYTLRIRNIGSDPISSALLTDALPTAFVTYVANSTVANYGFGPTAVTDDGTGSAFPLDGSGYTVTPIAVGATITVSFNVVVNGGLPAGTTTVSNSGLLSYDVFNLPAVADATVRGTIGDTVFRDNNGNGVQDPGEPGIDGVTVNLVLDANGNGSIDGGDTVVDSAVTAGGGFYRFVDLSEGKYIVDVTDTANKLTGAAITGGTAPRAVTLGAGANFDTADFGYQYRTDLQVTKTDGRTTAVPGQAVTYTITVTNAGPLVANGATVTDTLPASLTGATWTASYSGGSSGPMTGNGSINATINLAVGGTATFTVTGTVDSTATGTLSNTVTVTPPADLGDPTPGNNSATDTDTLTPIADLSLTKTVNNTTANVGSNVVFTITVNNTGPSAATGVTVGDLLPTGVQYVGDNSGGTYNPVTGTWTIGNLGSTGSATLQITATVLASGNYTNYAQVTASTAADPDSTPNDNSTNQDDDDSVTLTPTPVADLSLTKTVNNATAAIGTNVVFTITVNNAGPSTATGVAVRDLLPSGLQYVSDNSAGAFNSGTGVWTIGSIANGGSRTLQITATVLASGNYTNYAQVSASGTLDPDSTPNNGQQAPDEDDDASATVTPTPVVDVSLTNTVNNPTANVGTNVVFTVTVSNAGPSTATSVTVQDLLPTGVQYVSDNSGGNYNPATGIWTVGALPLNGMATIQITATVLAAGNYTSYAQVATTAEQDSDSTPGDNSTNQDDNASVALTPTPVADLSLTKTVDNATPAVGTTVTFTLVVMNGGPSPATGVQVQDLLPAGLTFVSSSDASYNPAASDSVWDIPSIASGGSATLTIVARVNVASAGSITNYAQVIASNELDPDSTPNNGPRLPDEDDDASVTFTPTAITVGDTVFFDVSGDGTQQGSEPGIAGVTVTLTYLGANGVPGGGDDQVFTALTDSNGHYSITDLPAGKYTVATSGLPTGVTNQTLGFATLTLSGSRNDIDFGFNGPGQIGDRVFLDVNGNGQYDAGEGLDGVTVTLTGDLTGDGTKDTLTVVTANDGLYQFSNLRTPPAGLPYTIVIGTAGLPGGVTNTADPDGGTPNQANITLTAANPTTNTQDFGYQGSGSIGDRVFLDLNGNGVWNPGEGITGVTVTLTGDVDGDGVAESFSAVTDADGFYQIGNLPVNNPAGKMITYTVAVNPSALPTGIASSVDPDAIADGSTIFNLLVNPTRTDLDFGYKGTGTLGDRVWVDANGDGVQGPAASEPGLPGVGLTLTYFGQDGVFGTADDITTTSATNQAGTYGFANLPAGKFRVAVNPATLPGGTVVTADHDDAPAFPATLDGSANVVLTAGQTRSDADFGYRGPGSIGDRIFLDLNGDGAWNPGEGITGVTVTLTGDLNGDGTPEAFTAVTDADGFYQFPGLPVNNPAGKMITYTVAVSPSALPTGIASSVDPDAVADGSTTFNLLVNPTRTDLDFGYKGTGTLGDRVWVDANGDGVQGTTAQEPGLPGVGLTLTYFGQDGVFGTADDITTTTTTNQAGTYGFANLPAGSFRVAVTPATLPGGVTPTADRDDSPTFPVALDGAANVVLTAGQTRSDADFGYRGPGSIGDRIFLDLNGDGAWNPGEGITGVTVSLTGDLNGDGTPEAFTAVTDADGFYQFPGLPVTDAAGKAISYMVTVSPANLPAGVTNAIDPDGTADNTTTFDLSANPTRSDLDFGYKGTGVLGDRVWIDANGDGVQGPAASEPGLPGVGLTLTYFGQDGVFGTTDDITTTTTTNQAGTYGFANLPAGSFRIAANPATLPGGAVVTADRDDTPAFTPALDGSANVTLTAAQVRTDVDFGYRGPGAIGDRIFLDVNGDGTWNQGEGLAGATVTLTGDVNGDGTSETFTVVTDADGFYTFAGLPVTDPTGKAITYTVTVNPASLSAGLTNAVDPDGTPDNATTLTLTANPTRSDLDFGYRGPGSIGDRIFLDLNGDGVWNPGEGITGVTVTLTGDVDGDGSVETFSAVTDADGFYQMGNLPVNDPSGKAIAYTAAVSPANLPAGVANASDLDGTPDGTTTFNLSASPVRTDLDFGYKGTGVLGDRVWIDANGDGVQGSAAQEPGLPGVGLTLTYFGQDGIFGTADDITTTAVTGSTGMYTLANLPAGSFRVTIDPASLPTNVTPTADRDDFTPALDGAANVTLTVGQSRSDVDFGYKGAATVGDSIFVDQNGNGVQDPTEPGVPGATVNLQWAGPDGVLGTADDQTFRTTTDATGFYAFPGLPVFGTSDPYRITVTPPLTGLNPTADPDGVATPSVADLSIPANLPFDTADFGYDGRGQTLGGSVYTDLNGNGVRDAGEPGIAGVTVRLSGTNVFGSPVVDPATGLAYYEATTDANGQYTFTNVFPGTYTITELQPAAYTDGGEAAGTLGGTVTDDRVSGIVVGVGSTGTGYNFGENRPSSISGTVYRDDNANGVQNAGEPGIANVRVTLTGTDDRGNPVSITVVTDAAGNYTFAGLRAGTYRIAELQPAGLDQGQNSIGSAGGQLASTDNLDSIVLGAGVAAVNYQFAETNPVRPSAVAPLPPLSPPPAPATEISKRDFLASTPAAAAQTTVNVRTTPNFTALGSINTNRPLQFLSTAEGVGGNLVRVFDLTDGQERFRFEPFPGNPGGVRVATADVSGDGIPDIITAAGPGGAPRVIIYDGQTGAVRQDFLAFESTFTGGLYVSAADLDGDGQADLVISPDVGGGPRVRILGGGDPTRVVADLMGIDDSSFRGGARTAVADIDGDGTPDVVVGAGVGGGPRVAVWDGRSLLAGAPTHLVADWFAFESSLRNGVYLTVGDVDGDGKADVIAGAGPGGAPRVIAFSGAGLMAGQATLVANYFVGNTTDRGGVPVAAVDLDGDGKTEVFTGAGTGSTPMARFTNPRTGQVIDEFAAENLDFVGGIQVG